MSTVDQANYNYLFDSPDQDEHFLDRPDFLAYAAMVEAVVHAASEPVCTREIHETLGAEARREWTLDALENLRSIELVPGLINRWQVYNATSPRLSKYLNRKNPSWMFAGKRKQEREEEFARQDAEAGTGSADVPSAAAATRIIRFDAETLKPIEGRGHGKNEVKVAPIRSGRKFDRQEVRRLVHHTTRQYRSLGRTAKYSPVS